MLAPGYDRSVNTTPVVVLSPEHLARYGDSMSDDHRTDRPTVDQPAPDQHQMLPKEQWYASLPTFMASAAALITDQDGSVLVVKPNYRPWWNLPGGVLEADEPPHLGCAREIAEETGLPVTVGRLLVMAWLPPTPIRKASFATLFDAGTVTDPGSVRLQTEELDEYAFVPVERAIGLLKASTAAILAEGVRVRPGTEVGYLWDLPVTA